MFTIPMMSAFAALFLKRCARFPLRGDQWGRRGIKFAGTQTVPPTARMLGTLGGMDIKGLGVDLAEISRVRRLLGIYGEKFRERCFTDHEWAYAHRYADPSARLAARFAGKEAVMKSLGMGWRAIRFRDVEITGGGAPRVNLSGTAARRAESIGVTRVMVTITHTDDRALVFAVSMGEH